MRNTNTVTPIIPRQVIFPCMKWLNHELVTGSAVYALSGGNIIYTVAAMAGSIIPDYLEGKSPEDKDEYRHWRCLHRRWSHWFVPYAVLALVIIFYSSFGMNGSSLLDALILGDGKAVCTVTGFFGIGGILHIAEDFLCGKVPSLNPRKRAGLKIFAVGSVRAYCFSLSIAAFFCVIMIK